MVKTLSEAGLFVCAVNPHLIKNFGNNSIREVKSDPADAKANLIALLDNPYPGVDESGQQRSKCNKASKCGSGRLRKTLFQIMSTLLQTAPENNKACQFLAKKRSEGKPYYVYMTAGANKFLRICYGKVKECTRNLEQ